VVHLRRDIQLVVPRLAEFAGPVPVRLGLEGLEHIGPVGLAEVPEALIGRAEVGDLAALREHEQPVAQAQVGHAVRDHDHRAPIMSHVGQQPHHRLVQAGVQAGCRLVQEEQGRPMR
jgi:hypothetical protein